MGKKRRDYDIEHIDSDRYRELKYCCYQYSKWKKEIDEINHNLKPSGLNYDGMPRRTNMSSPTEKMATRLIILKKRVECVEEAAKMASKDLAPYILLYCTVRDTSFADLEAKYEIPCSRATFDRSRALFFRHLSKLFDES